MFVACRYTHTLSIMANTGKNTRVTRTTKRAQGRDQSGEDQSRDRPAPPRAQHVPPKQNVRYNCGMCDQDLGSDECIGCDTCQSWFHPNAMCAGLPDGLIRSLLDYGGSGVRFVCSKCRVASQPQDKATAAEAKSESNDELVKQLFWSVKGICVALRELTCRLDATLEQITSKQDNSASSRPPPPTAPYDQEQHRRQIREEVREVQEQAKRRQSVVIRGLGVSSPNSAVTSFSDLTEKMFGTKVELSDVVAIPNNQDLLRAKILNEEHRKLVLTRAKSLRDTDYGHVFIRRDLTYKQRQELKNRLQTNSDNHGAATERPVSHPSARDRQPSAPPPPQPPPAHSPSPTEGNM